MAPKILFFWNQVPKPIIELVCGYMVVLLDFLGLCWNRDRFFWVLMSQWVNGSTYGLSGAS